MDDDFEIDLTADAPGDLLPIRWVGPGGAPSPTNGNRHNGNGHHGSNGGHTGADLDTVIDVASHTAPLVVTLESYVPQVAVTRQPAPSLTIFATDHEDEWDDQAVAITLRHAMASRGARFLAVAVVAVFALLVGATVLLWNRVEAPHRPSATQPGIVQASELRSVQNRLNSVETRLSSMLDDTQTVVTSPAPSVLEYELLLLRNCLVEFQRAIDVGRVRGGQFNYC